MSINNTLFRPSVVRAARQKFNPDGFDLAKALKQEKIKVYYLPPQNKQLGEDHLKAFADCQPVELIDCSADTERKIVIAAAYKQVFGNAHLMASERSPKAESQLCNGSITVLEFVRQLAKSERYRVLFFDNCTNLRTVELNFKHLLGRAPANHAEISEHIQILAEGGFEAEIDSYLDSDEYLENFGTNFVPYYRGYQTQTGKNLTGYTHSFQLLRGASSSDKSIENAAAPQLQSGLLADKPTQVTRLSAVDRSVLKPTPIKPVSEYTSSSSSTITSGQVNGTKYKSADFLAAPVAPDSWLQFKARNAAASFPAARLSQPVKVFASSSLEDKEILIQAAYKQVVGNAYLMESQRLVKAESRFKDGQTTVKGFIQELAQSDTYRSLFFDTCPNVRAVELNFKHLLGRSPESGAEISEHIVRIAEGGFEAEIDSYFNTSEYQDNFGEDTVPYYVGYATQTGKGVNGYNQIFDLIKGSCSSDKSVNESIRTSRAPQLQSTLLYQAPAKKVFGAPSAEELRQEFIAKSIGLQGNPNAKPPVDTVSNAYVRGFADNQPVEFVAASSSTNTDAVITAAYKQVFGNAHLMESEKSPQIESQLRNGQITVLEFIRQLAKSARYQALFFDGCSNLQAIELNFKHLLGRAPANYAEISEHIQIIAHEGFAGEIDSYLDSDEYTRNFGTNIVPYYRGYQTQTGQNLQSYVNSFQLLRGASSSDKSIASANYTELSTSLLSDRSSQIAAISTADSSAQTKQDLAKSTSTTVKAVTPIAPEDYPVINNSSVAQRVSVSQNTYNAMLNTGAVKVIPGSEGQNLDLVVTAVYKQVFGNAYVMESERLTVAESQFKQGNINVKEFVRCLAKSELYKNNFVNSCPRYRSHELNFKHLLGRAPASYEETVYHSNILDTQGYEADIDAYIDSEEYQQAFGDNTVPYYRGYQSQTGQALLGYTNMFEMLDSYSTSDKAGATGYKPRLQEQLMSKVPSSNVQSVTATVTEPVTDGTSLIQRVLGLI